MTATIGIVALITIAYLLISADTSSFTSDSGTIDVSNQVGYGMKLNPSQIAALASNAGFSGSDLATAVAVALAESGGKTTAYNPETAAGTPQGEGSFGLWQIYRRAHPEFDGDNLFDPQVNAFAAYSVYSDSGQTFTPWSTFNSGAYLAHMNVANQAAQAYA